jgi:hypothetical protein
MRSILVLIAIVLSLGAMYFIYKADDRPQYTPTPVSKWPKEWENWIPIEPEPTVFNLKIEYGQVVKHR